MIRIFTEGENFSLRPHPDIEGLVIVESLMKGPLERFFKKSIINRENSKYSVLLDIGLFGELIRDILERRK